MKVLFLGDVFGKPGREILKKKLPSLVEENNIDFIIANGENAAGGIGITPDICETLLYMGVDIITSGNHIYKKREIYDYIERQPRLLKPANYPPSTPGSGYHIMSDKKNNKIAVINICGRVFIDYFDCPFRTIDKILSNVRKETPVIIVDFHAEVTSEKVAMGWYLDGRVSAVVGTHTHVQTADERILPGGTAYITDVGMVGPRNSVIGVKKENIIKKFLTMMPQKFTVSEDDYLVNGVVININEKNGRAESINRLNIAIDKIDNI
ncbi:MAG: TIGR00282 family metallophosphoesterase [Actinomycetota bacterium]|nr:TIGR00282 family metallophosphoesterase [Actinomycetota bacterium]